MTEEPGLYKYILLSFLLLLSFYFSGSESAIFSLNRLERNSLKETKSAKQKKKLVFLLDNQDQLLISILTGNMIVNIFASSLGSEIGDFIFAGGSELLSIIGMTILLLLKPYKRLDLKYISAQYQRYKKRKTCPCAFCSRAWL